MICWIIVNVHWERLAIIKSYLSIIAPPIRILGQFCGHGLISKWRIHLSAGCFAIPSYWSTMSYIYLSGGFEYCLSWPVEDSVEAPPTLSGSPICKKKRMISALSCIKPLNNTFFIYIFTFRVPEIYGQLRSSPLELEKKSRKKGKKREWGKYGNLKIWENGIKRGKVENLWLLAIL